MMSLSTFICDKMTALSNFINQLIRIEVNINKCCSATNFGLFIVLFRLILNLVLVQKVISVFTDYLPISASVNYQHKEKISEANNIFCISPHLQTSQAAGNIK